MSLAVKLKKLEVTAGKGQWCALCRLILRSSPPTAGTLTKRRDEPEQKKKTCLFCGNVYNVSAQEGDEPRDRAVRLYNSFQEEEFYTVEQAAAVGAWIRQSKNRSPEEAEKREKKRQGTYYRHGKEKLTPEQKLKQKLSAEVNELYGRWHKEMKAKHGKPFPHIFELEEKIAQGFYRWSPASEELERWRAWASLEVIVFGGPLPDTTGRVAEYEEKAAAEEAEKQRREAERLEREQRYSDSRGY